MDFENKIYEKFGIIVQKFFKNGQVLAVPFNPI